MRRGRLVILALLGLAVAIPAAVVATRPPSRTTPVFDPPVLAGQQLWGGCAGGFHARRGSELCTTPDCDLVAPRP